MRFWQFIFLIVFALAKIDKKGNSFLLVCFVVVFFSLTVALTRQNVNEFKFEQRQAMRFPDRLNHHQHHLTVGRQQSNIRRGAGLSASPGKLHRKSACYFSSEASFGGLRFYDVNILKNVFPYPIILEFPSIPILRSIFLLTASPPRHLQAFINIFV